MFFFSRLVCNRQPGIHGSLEDAICYVWIFFFDFGKKISFEGAKDGGQQVRDKEIVSGCTLEPISHLLCSDLSIVCHRSVIILCHVLEYTIFFSDVL